MKKVKIAFWLLVLIGLGVVAYQNRKFLLESYQLGIDIGLVSYHTRNLAVAVYLLFFFFAGILITFLFSLTEKFRSKKTIRTLTENLDAEKTKVLELEAKLATIQKDQIQGTWVDTEKKAVSVAP